MRNGNELSDRKKLILKAVIDAHIENGEPVGSRLLTQNSSFSLSSATIRNEMAELETLGYLEQPHTSSGRIPSEAGYRFYVNSLMEKYRMTSAELSQLNNLLTNRVAELDKLIDHASKVMAAITNYTSLAVKPKPKHIVVSRFKTVPLDKSNFLLIMITSANVVNTKYVHTALDVCDESLAALEALLNDTLCGVMMDDITLPKMMELEARAGSLAPLISPVVKCMYEVVSEISDELNFEGVNKLLSYPEFADVDRMRGLLGMLEKKEDIIKVVATAENDKMNVYIGSENSVDIMRSSTLIFKTITCGGNTIGAIGVIGPCRMDYSKVISTVEYLSRQIKSAAGADDGEISLPPGAKNSSGGAKT
ncbi:MAG: heat-inducible transcriptional repressor HrcA [Eubacteriales bacterium]